MYWFIIFIGIVLIDKYSAVGWMNLLLSACRVYLLAAIKVKSLYFLMPCIFFCLLLCQATKLRQYLDVQIRYTSDSKGACIELNHLHLVYGNKKIITKKTKKLIEYLRTWASIKSINGYVNVGKKTATMYFNELKAREIWTSSVRIFWCQRILNNQFKQGQLRHPISSWITKEAFIKRQAHTTSRRLAADNIIHFEIPLFMFFQMFKHKT